MKENLSYRHTEDGEVHPGEVVEEKIRCPSASGLWSASIRSARTSTSGDRRPVAAPLASARLRSATRGRSRWWGVERGSRSGGWRTSSRATTAGGTVAAAERVVEVAVGVLIDAAGRFLLTSRPLRARHHAGYREFPGASSRSARRGRAGPAPRTHEELGITIGGARPRQVEVVDYPHARACARHFCKVFDWAGAFETRQLPGDGGRRCRWRCRRRCRARCRCSTGLSASAAMPGRRSTPR